MTPAYYSPILNGCTNMVVLEQQTGRERMIGNVLFASSEKQQCLVLGEGHDGQPDVGILNHPFKIVDVRDGGEGKQPVDALFGRFDRVLVMGGGSSLQSQVDSLDIGGRDATISINHHAAAFYPADFVCFCDRHTDDLLQSFPGVKLSIWGDLSDYRIDASHVPAGFFYSSPFLALSLAEKMGTETLLAGFDLYQDGKYATGETAAARVSLAEELASWAVAKGFLSHPERVKVLGGPLTEIFQSDKGM